MKMLLYCTKSKPYLADFKGEYRTFSNSKDLDELWDKGFNPNDIMNILNGKIVAECDYEVEKIIPINVSDDDYDYGLYSGKDLLKESCLSNSDIYEYLQDDNGKEIFNKGYAIIIKHLNIFDEPREFSKCYYLTLEKGFLRQIKKAPQNMCYALTTRDDKDILISIKPEWICKILNGEKTIEVRKKVLKEML